MNLWKIIAAGLLVGVGIFFWYLTDAQEESIEKTVREIEGHVAWNQQEAAAAVATAEKAWAAAADCLQQGAWDEARTLYCRGDRAVKPFVSRHGAKSIGEGLPLGVWYDKQNRIYLRALLDALPGLIARLTRGEIDPDTARALVTGYAAPRFRPLQDAFDTQRPAIVAARATRAVSRVAVNVYGGTEEYRGLVEKLVAEKWDESAPFALVFGNTMGGEEGRTTWKTLQVGIEEKTARYAAADEELRNLNVSGIPSRVTVTFRIRSNHDETTSWDDLETITAETDVPETLWIKITRKHGSVTLSNTIAEKRAALREGLAAAWRRSFPAFELFPGVETAALKVVAADGTFDRRAAMALFYGDRERFEKQIEAVLANNPAEHRGELGALFVSLRRENRAAWIQQNIPAADAAQQREVMKALDRNPAFASFKPLLGLLDSTDRSIRSRAATRLGPYLQSETLREALTERIGDAPGKETAALVRVFLKNAPVEELAACATWVAAGDPDVARQVFTVIRGRAPDLSRDITRSLFEKVHPDVRAAMVDNYPFGRDGPAPPELALLKKALLQNTHESQRTNALNSLVRAAAQPPVWRLLRECRDNPVLPDRCRERIARELIPKSRSGNPGGARAFLLGEIERLMDTGADSAPAAAVPPGLQGGAILALLDCCADKRDAVAPLADIIKENPGNVPLLNRTVRAIWQYRRIRGGWDWKQKELVKIVFRAIGTNHDDTRRTALKIARYGYEHGAEQYGVFLEEAGAAGP